MGYPEKQIPFGNDRQEKQKQKQRQKQRQKQKQKQKQKQRQIVRRRAGCVYSI